MTSKHYVEVEVLDVRIICPNPTHEILSLTHIQELKSPPAIKNLFRNLGLKLDAGINEIKESLEPPKIIEVITEFNKWVILKDIGEEDRAGYIEIYEKSVRFENRRARLFVERYYNPEKYPDRTEVTISTFTPVEQEIEVKTGDGSVFHIFDAVDAVEIYDKDLIGKTIKLEMSILYADNIEKLKTGKLGILKVENDGSCSSRLTLM